MSIKQLIARSVLLSVLANPVHAAVIRSTFDASNEGWIGIPNEGSVAFFSSNGNPDGHIRVTDIGVGPGLGSGAIAPSKFLGNLSGFINGTLSVDLGTFAGSGGTFSIFGMVQISSANDTVFCDLATTAPPFGTWLTFSAPFTAATCGTTSLRLMRILADVTEIAIGTDAFDGNDTIGIDNFTLATAACIASGEISRISVNPGGLVSSFYVRMSTPGSVSFLFGTTDGKVINAALKAQASHMRVTVTGSATACGAVAGGSSAGGTVTNIITAP